MSSAQNEFFCSQTLYTAEELLSLDLDKVPKHVAIIMDGNRRWAKKNHLSSMIGHWKGAETMITVVNAAMVLGVKVLTVFAFSTENWARSRFEIESLMFLYRKFLIDQRSFMIEEGVKLETIGDLSRMPAGVVEAIEESKKLTAHCNRIQLVLAFNYGGRDEIRRAIVSLCEDYKQNKINSDQISEEVLSKYLDTASWEDPQLLIRTSGEQRISNFLLWQISYTELYVTDVLWPDFDQKELLKAIIEYQHRERRLGG